MKRILMLSSLCAILLYTSCMSHQEKEETETKFLVTSPLKTDTSITKDYVCQISAARHIELRAQERGYLQEILIDEGQFVKKGQLLFRIMPKIYEAEFKSAEAEAKVAEIEYQNTKRLADSDIVSVNELAMSKAKYDKAKAELSLAKVHLEFTEIRAPFDGIIDRFHLKLGSLVDEGDLLSTLSDNSEMWVYFNVPEAEYLEYKSSEKNDTLMKVKLLMANNKLFDQSGYVKAIEADFNNETGNIAFRATFPNPKGLLRHGETGNIQTSISFKDALLIPQKTTFEILDKRYVYVIDRENKVKLKPIAVDAEMPDLYIISDDLKETDKILLEGLRKVTDGAEIQYDYQKPRSVIANLKLYTE
ncbi:MAG: efflux RND transporter periplasmic adaptor subunit [Flavipsychrobacter sp.]